MLWAFVFFLFFLSQNEILLAQKNFDASTSIRSKLSRGMYLLGRWERCKNKYPIKACNEERVSACLAAIGNWNCDEGKLLTAFKENMDVQESVFFDYVAQEQVRENICELNYLQKLDRQASVKDLLKVQPALEKSQAIHSKLDNLKLHKPPVNLHRNAKDLQQQIVQDLANKLEPMREVYGKLIRLQSEITKLTNKHRRTSRYRRSGIVTTRFRDSSGKELSYGTRDEALKFLKRQKAELEMAFNSIKFSIWNATEPRMEKYIQQQLYRKESPKEFVQKAMSLSGNLSFQKRIIDPMKTEAQHNLVKLSKLQGKDYNPVTAKSHFRSYSDKFGRDITKNELYEKYIQKLEDQYGPIFDALACHIDAGYGSGRTRLFWAGQAALLIASFGTSAWLNTLSNGVRLGFYSAKNARILSLVLIGEEVSIDLLSAYISDCLPDNSADQFKSNICTSTNSENINRVQFQRHEIEATNCKLGLALSSVMGLNTIKDLKKLKTLNEISQKQITLVDITKKRAIDDITRTKGNLRYDSKSLKKPSLVVVEKYRKQQRPIPAIWDPFIEGGYIYEDYILKMEKFGKTYSRKLVEAVEKNPDVKRMNFSEAGGRIEALPVNRVEVYKYTDKDGKVFYLRKVASQVRRDIKIRDQEGNLLRRFDNVLVGNDASRKILAVKEVDKLLGGKFRPEVKVVKRKEDGEVFLLSNEVKGKSFCNPRSKRTENCFKVEDLSAEARSDSEVFEFLIGNWDGVPRNFRVTANGRAVGFDDDRAFSIGLVWPRPQGSTPIFGDGLPQLYTKTMVTNIRKMLSEGRKSLYKKIGKELTPEEFESLWFRLEIIAEDMTQKAY